MKKIIILLALNLCISQIHVSAQFQPVYGNSVVNIQGNFYLFGGIRSNTSNTPVFTNDTYTFSPKTNQWSKETVQNTPPAGRAYHSAVAYNNKMYVFFGQGASGDMNDIWAYDPATKQWQQQSDSGQTITAREQTCAVLAGNSVYLIGGMQGSTILTDFFSLDFTTSKISTLIGIPSGATEGISGASFNGMLYFFGGEGVSGIESDTWYYDTQMKFWSLLTTQGVAPARKNQVTVQDAQNMWICGGSGSSKGNQYLTSILHFDPVTYAYTQVANNFPAGDFRNALVMDIDSSGNKHDTLFYFWGGIDSTNQALFSYKLNTQQAQTFDTLTNNWIDYNPTTAINQYNSGNNILISTNPDAHTLSITCPEKQNTTLQIYNITGEIVLQKELNSIENNISTGSLAKGVYVVEVRTTTELLAVKKFIKE